MNILIKLKEIKEIFHIILCGYLVQASWQGITGLVFFNYY